MAKDNELISGLLRFGRADPEASLLVFATFMFPKNELLSKGLKSCPGRIRKRTYLIERKGLTGDLARNFFVFNFVNKVQENTRLMSRRFNLQPVTVFVYRYSKSALYYLRNVIKSKTRKSIGIWNTEKIITLINTNNSFILP